MDAEYKDIFTSIRVTEDTTNGLIKLEAVKRYGQDRNTKVKNNFVGQLSKADSSTLLQLARLLNEQLPPKTDNEVVVGLMTSGVIMCGYLALIRKSFFNYSIYSKFGDYEDEFSFSEGHRDDKKHYLYGIKPGDEIIIIEDEVTSGNGIIALVNALREYGVTVKSVACVLETTNFRARKNIFEQTNLDLISLAKIKLVK